MEFLESDVVMMGMMVMVMVLVVVNEEAFRVAWGQMAKHWK